MKTLQRSLLALVSLVLLSAPAMAQTALTTTTLGAALDNAQQVATVASATGITAPGSGATFVYLLIDKEILEVRSINTTSLAAGVGRGRNGTRATSHVNGAAVTVVPPGALLNYLPSGQCTRTQLSYVPVVVGGSNVQSDNGSTFDCLGVTTAGQYVQTNANNNIVLGSTVVTAATISATGTYFKTSGTTAVVTINVPAGAQPGFALTIEATGSGSGITWTAAGNILTAGTYGVTAHALTFVWNGAKWVPPCITCA